MEFQFGEWTLRLPTMFKRATPKSRFACVKILGFGVLWDKRPASVHRFKFIRPHFDSSERVAALIQAVRKAEWQRKLEEGK